MYLSDHVRRSPIWVRCQKLECRSPILISFVVTYHRYLRFYPDGSVISFLTTDQYVLSPRVMIFTNIAWKSFRSRSDSPSFIARQRLTLWSLATHPPRRHTKSRNRPRMGSVQIWRKASRKNHRLGPVRARGGRSKIRIWDGIGFKADESWKVNLRADCHYMNY